jgi:hypothetical protein
MQREIDPKVCEPSRVFDVEEVDRLFGNVVKSRCLRGLEKMASPKTLEKPRVSIAPIVEWKLWWGRK